MTTPTIPLAALVEAAEALRRVKAMHLGEVMSLDLWLVCMNASVTLDSRLKPILEQHRIELVTQAAELEAARKDARESLLRQLPEHLTDLGDREFLTEVLAEAARKVLTAAKAGEAKIPGDATTLPTPAARVSQPAPVTPQLDKS